jgi:hypothetical protein
VHRGNFNFFSFSPVTKEILPERGQYQAPVAIIPVQVSPNGQLVMSAGPVIIDETGAQSAAYGTINLNQKW